MVELEIAQIDAVDQDVPGGRVPKAQQQVGERRLAGAGRADDRDRRAGRDVELTPLSAGRRAPG